MVFEEIPSDTLSEVIAVAMDMNTSYDQFVAKYLPNAQIVYLFLRIPVRASVPVLSIDADSAR